MALSSEEKKLLDWFSARVIQELGSDLEAATVVTRTLIEVCRDD